MGEKYPWLDNSDERKHMSDREILEKYINLCYVMQTVVSVSCLGDKCLSHAKLMSTTLTKLLIFRFSCLLTNKGIVQCTNNSN